MMTPCGIYMKPSRTGGFTALPLPGSAQPMVSKSGNAREAPRPFAVRPLVNIHDFFVAPAHRGTGISRMLFAAIEQRARELGCCKLTLEVLENNHCARRVYAAAGFAPPQYAPGTCGSLFLATVL